MATYLLDTTVFSLLVKEHPRVRTRLSTLEAETEQQRKSKRQTLSHYLRIVEGKEALPDKKVLRPSAKRGG